MKRLMVALWMAIAVTVSHTAAAQNADWAKPLESSNMRIVGHSDLNGRGNGGEGSR